MTEPGKVARSGGSHRSDGSSVSDSGRGNVLITKDFRQSLIRIEWLCFYTIIFDLPHLSSTVKNQETGSLLPDDVSSIFERERERERA